MGEKPATLFPEKCKKIVWLDLQSSSEEEKKSVEDTFQIELFTPQEAAEIESSSKYYEDENNIEANNAFLVYDTKSYTPTLIASAYGLNFDFIPELKWTAGYPYSISLMLLSSLKFLWFFKRKKWL